MKTRLRVHVHTRTYGNMHTRIHTSTRVQGILETKKLTISLSMILFAGA